MRYPSDYRIICHPSEMDRIVITVPTGETSLSRVKKDVKNRFGSIELTDVSLNTFLNIYPGDRIFRNAWQLGSTSIIEPFPLCQKVVREKRNHTLNWLDHVAFRESRKPKGRLKMVNKVAQQLRDLPQQKEFHSKNIADLKGLMRYMDSIYPVLKQDIPLDCLITESLLIQSGFFEKMKQFFRKWTHEGVYYGSVPKSV